MFFEQTKEAKEEVSVLRKKLSEYQAVAAGADYQVRTKRHVKKMHLSASYDRRSMALLLHMAHSHNRVVGNFTKWKVAKSDTHAQVLLG